MVELMLARLMKRAKKVRSYLEQKEILSKTSPERAKCFANYRVRLRRMTGGKRKSLVMLLVRSRI